ncbi:restriction endonuclease [Streptomyces genisteinicus]|uniref:Restriction endonuclease n=1 Tax=Streptomyces genisteinicus TaxID=2768068 RepID=A0A7H0HTT6_9ACTN|nr:restriction endonuclease [Streptomyces genisteinicus]QNP63952.1 restriction endonuclease [Streptomyces genisteinicus]
MGRRSGGLISSWAEAQRQQQRQREAQQLAVLRQQREHDRRQREHARDMARMHREQRAAYRSRREQEVLLRTQELDAQVAALEGLLAEGCAAAPFSTETLRREETVEPFAPGALAQPVVMPDPSRYQSHGGAWTAAGRAQAQQEARARYEHDWYAAQAAESRRLADLETYRRQYDAWASARLAEIRTHNAGITEMVRALRADEPDTVVEYFSAALCASAAWPDGFPRQVSAAYDRAARQLVLDWELPAYQAVPEAKGVRYLVGTDQEKVVPRPVAQRRALYRDVLAQSVLLAVRELYAADEPGVLDGVVLNGFVDDVDPATGRAGRIVVASLSVGRADFQAVNLALVSAVDCLTGGLGGHLSARPDQRAAVRPLRSPAQVGSGVVSHGDGEEPDLLAMDPIAFEGLVAELFRARGFQAMTTQRSNDGGVDVDAVDPDPISGGKIFVQVKRYRRTVPVAAVRELFGTVQAGGANKGVLVTTSGFGPGAYTFANGKPLTLVSGAELVELLHTHGLRGRLGDGTGPAPSAAAAPEPDVPDASDGSDDAGEGHFDEDFNVLGMSWRGGVALDVCALVCTGGRVLGDEHFVFFNNHATPEGSVRMMRSFAGDRAAIRVDFDRLPASADRLVLVAAIDPEVDPEADLASFTDAGIRLRDASGAELDRLVVSDGRPGETALVLGSFRRRASGDWDFVLGGKGYTGGLEELVGDFGIEVA